ncbi:type II toxin-antitoxin system VapC family toxin [Nostoc sp. UHCC 0870]|uniref:type II toxin-antitoxin system VapC family toxin n=1 Tax=Nostoc sp. UHCC 0870 TaxID=2914041 RepID=UPI001EDFF831|nr:type II toxin-antitoxin system VapC family toxin [Nostoc sp. UHCC 0870]UKO96373.1 type II toxin-antitoxin system VapC family toxin [Nostoc sp. UHCC 0870]
MSRKKTYIDSGVLIAAFRGVQSIGIQANTILNDDNREFVSSQFVKLEVVPKAIYNQQQDETDFYETFFSAVSYWATDLEQISQDAYQLSSLYGLAAMDALHVAAAIWLKADELITTEKPTKPMHRVKKIQIISI